MKLNEKIIEENIVYKSPIFTATSGIVELPDGQRARRDRVLHNGGAGVLPMDTDGQVYLVEQYRYGIGELTLEIPAGKLEKGEDPETCAMRELQEEVGGKCETLTFYGRVAPTPAYDSEIIYVYKALCTEFTSQHLDADEFLHIQKMPLSEALQLVLENKIIDAKTQYAILKASITERDLPR